MMGEGGAGSRSGLGLGKRQAEPLKVSRPGERPADRPAPLHRALPPRHRPGPQFTHGVLTGPVRLLYMNPLDLHNTLCSLILMSRKPRQHVLLCDRGEVQRVAVGGLQWTPVARVPLASRLVTDPGPGQQSKLQSLTSNKQSLWCVPVRSVVT